MSVPQSPQQSSPSTVSAPPSRYSSVVDLSDLNSAHTLGILAVPPGSSVLDIGAADGSVARALTARGCRVWAIEIEPEAARAAGHVCERVFCGDAVAILRDEIDEACRFDAILALDVLEHLPDPAAALAEARRFLSPHGRLIASIPNVAHGAVRLQLLEGRFARTERGLLDRTHLHFFDRDAMYALMRRSGLVVCDELRTRRRLTETEIAVDLEALPRDAVRLASADPDAETYQFIVIAASAASAAARDESLLQSLQLRGERLEEQYRTLEAYAKSLERALAEAQQRLQAADAPAVRRQIQEELHDSLRLQTAALERQIEQLTRLHAGALDDAARLRQQASRIPQLSEEIEQLRASLGRSHAAAAEVTAAAADARAAAAGAESRARESAAQLVDVRRQSAHLRRELALREAYVVELRQRADQAAAEIESARSELRQTRERAEAASRATELSAAHETALAAMNCELAVVRSHADDARRLLAERESMPRYRLADGANRLLKRVPVVHRLLKQLYFALATPSSR